MVRLTRGIGPDPEPTDKVVDVIAVLAPGQGAQVPGMLSAWLELPSVQEAMARYGDLVGMDLVGLGTSGTAAQITDTAVTQPLLAATALISADQLGLLTGGPDDVLLAGHSIGELPAAAVAGALSADDAVRFAGHRGAAMAAACREEPSAMAAVMGGDPAEVLAAIAAADCVPANRNGAGQVVAAGAQAAVETLIASPPAGARVRPLQVAGAFHTRFMAPAEATLAGWVPTALQVRPLRRTLLSNADGQPITDVGQLLQRLVGAVTRPVRWDLCLETMGRRGVDTVIELAPGGVLAGLARRALPDATTIAIKSPLDLDVARTALGASS